MEKRTLVYWIILAVLVIALGTVGVLILRKRASLPGATGTGIQNQSGTKNETPKAKPIESYVPERPFKAGDAPIDTFGPDVQGTPEPTTP